MLPPAVIDHCSSHVAALLPSDRTVTLRSLSALVRPQSVDVRRMCRVSLTGSTAHRALRIGSRRCALLCCTVLCCAGSWLDPHAHAARVLRRQCVCAQLQPTHSIFSRCFRAEQSSLDWRATGECILGHSVRTARSADSLCAAAAALDNFDTLSASSADLVSCDSESPLGDSALIESDDEPSADRGTPQVQCQPHSKAAELLPIALLSWERRPKPHLKPTESIRPIRVCLHALRRQAL